MKWDDVIAGSQELTEWTNSKQYQYSRQLIRARHELGLNQQNMAKLLDINYFEYLELEFSTPDIPVNRYLEVITRFMNVTSVELEDVLKEEIR